MEVVVAFRTRLEWITELFVFTYRIIVKKEYRLKCGRYVQCTYLHLS